jgi:site-specific DNA-methyltransferase (cytosine-N4-specific)
MTVRILAGDCRDVLPTLEAESFDCVVTSPPYWRHRDYESDGQIGQEETPAEYADALVSVFRSVRRSLKPRGSVWINLGDTYAAGGNGGGGSLVARRRQWTGAPKRKGWRRQPAGFKEKDITLAPFLVADGLRADGWWLRSTIIWDKQVATEPPRADRPSTAHEYVFLLAKSEQYAVADPGEAWFRSTVWSIRSQPSGTGHPAVMPTELAERCIKAGCPAGGLVLDPFGGAGTTGLAADRLQRSAVLIELNPGYAEMALKRIRGEAPLLAEVAAE